MIISIVIIRNKALYDKHLFHLLYIYIYSCVCIWIRSDRGTNLYDPTFVPHFFLHQSQRYWKLHSNSSISAAHNSKVVGYFIHLKLCDDRALLFDTKEYCGRTGVGTNMLMNAAYYYVFLDVFNANSINSNKFGGRSSFWGIKRQN